MQYCYQCHRDPISFGVLCAACSAVYPKKVSPASEVFVDPVLTKMSIACLTGTPMTDQPETKDSGTRRAFDTGSQRDAATGKGRFELLSPMVTRRDAGLMERGAIKYDARNWEKGQPLSVYMDCAMRHLQKHLMGYRDEDHLAAARWNIAGIMHTEHQIARGFLPKELDDLPCYVTDEERQSGEGW